MKYLKINGIVPRLITRWYTDDWSFNLTDLSGDLILESLFSLLVSPIVLGIFYIYRRWRGKSIKLGKAYLLTLLLT
ncbi:MAG TPA: hypothetical protein VIH61_00335, partial [Waddliaceae bacterium]